MSNSKKKLARALREKTGMSHQAAMNVLNGASRNGGNRAFLGRVVDLAEASLREYKAAYASVSHDRELKKAKTMERIMAGRSAEEAALHRELERASVKALSVLQAVMWVGRDDGDDATREDVAGRLRHAQESTSDERKHEAIHYIEEKAPLAEYLADGLRILDRLGVDVNSL